MTKSLRIFLILALVSLMASPAALAAGKNNRSAQSVQSDSASGATYYAELVGTVNPMTGATQVVIEMGRTIATDAEVSPVELKRLLAAHPFSSLSDAMTYLSSFCWKLESTYSLSVRNQTSIRWVISKTVETPHELLDGIK